MHVHGCSFHCAVRFSARVRTLSPRGPSEGIPSWTVPLGSRLSPWRGQVPVRSSDENIRNRVCFVWGSSRHARPLISRAPSDFTRACSSWSGCSLLLGASCTRLGPVVPPRSRPESLAASLDDGWNPAELEKPAPCSLPSESLSLSQLRKCVCYSSVSRHFSDSACVSLPSAESAIIPSSVVVTHVGVRLSRPGSRLTPPLSRGRVFRWQVPPGF